MKIASLILLQLLLYNLALATEGIKASCTETTNHGNRKGSYPLPVSFLQAGDSISFGSHIHISERYMLTVVPIISNLTQHAADTREIGDPGTYEILLTQLPPHEKHPFSAERVCHATSIVMAGAETRTIQLKYFKKDDVGGFLPFKTNIHCEFSIINI